MRRHAWVLIAYAVLGLLLTWPMAAHLASHVPGDGIDDPSLVWNLWWNKHALVDAPQNPFAVGWQFWPVGINLAFYTLTVLNGLLGVPLQAAIGLIPAYNLLLLSSFAVGAFGAYLLCLDFLRRTTRRPRTLAFASAIIGGAFYAFAAPKMFYAALGQGNIASSQWLPFAALYIVRAARPGGRPRDAVLAGLFVLLQAYAELTYASFLAILAGLAVLWGLWLQAHGRHENEVSAGHHAGGEGLGLLARFGLLGPVVLIGVLPILANMLPDLRAEGDFFTSGGGFADIFSADLAGYSVPIQLHPILGGVIRDWSNNSTPRPDGSYFAVNKGQQIYLGYVAMALAALGLWRGRRRRVAWFWAIACLLFFLLTLGPSLRVAGYDLKLPLPFAVVAQLPFFKGNRYPSRYSVMLLLSMAPLVSLGVMEVLGWRNRAGGTAGLSARRLWPAAAILALLLFEHLSAPLPLSDLRVPVLYDRVASQPGDFALLELPLGWRNGARVAGKQDAIIMQELWDQTHHGKRLLGGNTSRNPEFKFQYFSEDPTLARLIALTNAADLPQHDALRAALAEQPIGAEDRARARDWAATLAIRYVMIHRDKMPAATEEALRNLLPVRLVGEEGPLALYAIGEELKPPGTFLVGTDQGRAVLAEGWSPPQPAASGKEPVFAEREEARLLLPFAPEAARLRLDMQAMAPNQSVMLVVNGRSMGTQPLSMQGGSLVFDVPADPARPVLSDVRLRFSALGPVTEAATGPWPVGGTAAKTPASILVRSAGQETGDFAHVYVNGVDLAPGGRGYNLVALSPSDGRLLARAAFDTHAGADAGTALAGWVKSLPQGAIVAGAVKDEASMNLSRHAVEALASLGVAADLRGRFRWGHAFVGAAGAPAGTALEAIDGVRTAQVSVGLPVSAPQVAAALVEVSIDK